MKTALDRFTEKVDLSDPTECWPWTGCKNKAGYGFFRGEEGVRIVHRYAYESLVGPIPEGLHIDHLCRNRACINPDHLEPVTPGENIRRGENYQRSKTHCPQGHPYSPENTYRTKHARSCRTCVLARMRRRRA